MHLKMLVYVVVMCCWGHTMSIPQHLISDFKSTLLTLFDLKERPKLEQRPQIPEALRRMYDAQNALEYDTASLPLPGYRTGSANTVRSFAHVESRIDKKFANSRRRFFLKFNVSSIPQIEKLKAAEIQLTRASLTTRGSPFQQIVLHDILQPGVKGRDGPITRVIDSKTVDTRQNSTVSLTVFDAVERWLEAPKSNFGLLVDVHTSKDSPPPEQHLRLRRDASTDWHHKQPLLFTFTDDGKNRQRTAEEMLRMRPKRGVKRSHRKNERSPCRRLSMNVEFKSVGWNDWIVAPLGFDAFYCMGECEYPMPEHMNTTNHAIVQSLVNSVDPSKVPKPCCVPTQLSSMSMLYLDNDKSVILKNYKEMVVEGCGCR